MTTKPPTLSQRSAQMQKELKREFNQCGKKKSAPTKKQNKSTTGLSKKAKFLEKSRKWKAMEEAEKKNMAGKAGKPL